MLHNLAIFQNMIWLVKMLFIKIDDQMSEDMFQITIDTMSQVQ